MADRGIPVSAGRVFDLHELFALDLSLAGPQKREFTLAAYRRSFLPSGHAGFSHRGSSRVGVDTVDCGSWVCFSGGSFLLYRDCHQGLQTRPAEIAACNGAHARKLGLTLQDSSAYSPFRDPTQNFRECPPRQLLRGYNTFVEDRFPFMARGNFGERLKRERELREVSMDELTKATRISKRFVEALENEDWARLPGGVFGHGFVRTIARYLGLNEEALLGEYDLARADHLAAAPPKVEERIPSPPKWLPVAAVLILLLLLVGLFYAGRYGWHRFAAYRASKKSATASSPVQQQVQFDPSSPGSAEQFSAADPSKAPLDLSVSTSAATRVRVLADDKLLLDAELPAGETRHFPANDHFEVSAGDSSAVLLELNHKAMPPLGAPGASGKIVLSEKDLRP